MVKTYPSHFCHTPGSSKSLDRGCLDRLGAKEVVVRVQPSNSDGTWFWTWSLSKSAVIIEQKAKGPFPIFLYYGKLGCCYYFVLFA